MQQLGHSLTLTLTLTLTLIGGLAAVGLLPTIRRTF